MVTFRSCWMQGKEYPLDAYTVRETVFVKERGKDRREEFDEIDSRAWHLIAYQDDRPCATLRLHNLGEKWQLSKLCVLKECRGKRIGEHLVFRAFEKLPEGHELYLQTEEGLECYFARHGFRQLEEDVMYCRVRHPELEKV